MITDINCPACSYSFSVDDTLWEYSKMADNAGLYYFNCKGCKERLGFTLLMMPINGMDYSIWLKKEEK